MRVMSPTSITISKIAVSIRLRGFFPLLRNIVAPPLPSTMVRTYSSRAKRARSSSTESTDDERLQPTRIRGPGKRLKAKSTTSGSGNLESTTSEPACTLNEMIALDGRTSESDGDELDEGPSLTTTRSHPSKRLATRPLKRQTLDELIRKAHRRYYLAKTLLSTSRKGYTDWIWIRAMSWSTSICAVFQS